MSQKGKKEDVRRLKLIPAFRPLNLTSMQSAKSRDAKRDCVREDRTGRSEEGSGERSKISFFLSHLWTKDGVSLDRVEGGGCFNLPIL